MVIGWRTPEIFLKKVLTLDVFEAEGKIVDVLVCRNMVFTMLICGQKMQTAVATANPNKKHGNTVKTGVSNNC